MRVFWAALALFCAMSALPASAAVVEATIDLSEQKMYVYENGMLRHSWAVSTARGGYVTPVGNYQPIRLERMWHSRRYDWSPMPYSVFFKGGYAIHGTEYVKSLGRPASHGCIRLHPDNARILYEMVQSAGPGNTAIRVSR